MLFYGPVLLLGVPLLLPLLELFFFEQGQEHGHA
jgi:hypothetical protein